jgi:hypothetical protein
LGQQDHHAEDHKDQQYKDLSHYFPLSLVRRLVGKLDHPGPGTKLKELDPPRGLGEQVRKLVLGAPLLQVASDEVVPHPDMLAPFMKNGVLCQG